MVFFTLHSNPMLLATAPEHGLVAAEDIGRFLQRFRARQDAPDMLLLDLFKVTKSPMFYVRH